MVFVFLLLFFFFVVQILTSCAIVSFECLRLLTLKPPLQMSLSVPQLCLYRSMNVYCFSKPQTFKAPLTLIRCRCVLLVASAAARSEHGKKQNKKQENDEHATCWPKGPFPQSFPTSLASVTAPSVRQEGGPRSLTAVRKAGNSLFPWLCTMLVCLPQ